MGDGRAPGLEPRAFRGFPVRLLGHAAVSGAAALAFAGVFRCRTISSDLSCGQCPAWPKSTHFGGLVKQYQVIVNPDRLTSYGISLSQLFTALEKNNANANGNFIEHQSEQYIIQGIGLVKDTTDIENIIVASHDRTPIFVRDLAEVKIGSELRQGVVTSMGEGEVVSGIVMALKGASGRDVVNAVKEKLPEIKKALPKGVKLVPFYDRTELVKTAINTVTKALRSNCLYSSSLCNLGKTLEYYCNGTATTLRFATASACAANARHEPSAPARRLHALVRRLLTASDAQKPYSASSPTGSGSPGIAPLAG
jgi:hypothetical protein